MVRPFQLWPINCLQGGGWLTGLIALLILFVGAPFARVHAGPVEAAQTEAVRKYPELGRAGSPMNAAFVAEVQRVKTDEPAILSNPRWPVLLADRVARRGPVWERLQTDLWKLGFIYLCQLLSLWLLAQMISSASWLFARAAAVTAGSVVAAFGLYFVTFLAITCLIQAGLPRLSIIVIFVAIVVCFAICWIVIVASVFEISRGQAFFLNVCVNLAVGGISAATGISHHLNGFQHLMTLLDWRY